MSYTIYVPQSVYMDNSISDLEVTYYIFINYFVKNNLPIHSKLLMDFMYGEGNYSEKKSRNIHPTIKLLLDKGIIKGNKTYRDSYSINPDSLCFEGAYAQVLYDDIIKILRSGAKNAHQLIRYYCWVMGSRRGIVGHMSLTYFAQSLECDIKTIYRYNSKLEELDILYIKRSDSIKIRDDGGSVYRENNYYCSSIDKLKLKA